MLLAGLRPTSPWITDATRPESKTA